MDVQTTLRSIVPEDAINEPVLFTLGHSDIRQTLQYSHISFDVLTEGIDKLDE